MNDRQLTSWREAYRALQSEGSELCSDDVGLAALAVGKLKAPLRHELADHVVACQRCFARYRGFAQLDETAGLPN